MMEKDIYLGTGFIDFYVNKDDFRKYKTTGGQFTFVKRVLDLILESLAGTEVGGLTFRKVFIGEYDYWGQDEFLIINDLGYSAGTPRPLRKDKVTIRIYQIRAVAKLTTPSDIMPFPTITTPDYFLKFSGGELV